MDIDYDNQIGSLYVSKLDSPEWLWYYIWLENWNSVYCALICMGVSFLNFQIYNILLISYPTFFITLCAALGVTNLILTFCIASAAIIGGGILIGTLGYAILLLTNSLSQTHELSNNMGLIEIWTDYASKPTKIIKLLNDESFYTLSTILSGKIISSPLQNKLILDTSFRHLVYKLLNKLLIDGDVSLLKENFNKDFHDFLEKIFANGDVKLRLNNICSCLDILPTLESPPYETLSYMFSEENHTKLLERCTELHIYQEYHLTPILSWKLLDNIKYKSFFLTAINRQTSHNDIVKSLNQFYEFTETDANLETISANERAESPTLQHAHNYYLKHKIINQIWIKLQNNMENFFSIFLLITNNPQIDLINPLLEICLSHVHENELFNYLEAIANIGYFTFNTENYQNLWIVYESEKLMPSFLNIIEFLIEAKGLIEIIFNELLLDIDAIPLVHRMLELCLSFHNPLSLEEIFSLISSCKDLKDHTLSDTQCIDEIKICLNNANRIQLTPKELSPNNLSTIREDDLSPYPFSP